MKINWGHKIAGFYLVFVAGIVYMVVLSSQQKVDLVTADYYNEEIKFQEKIDEKGRASALSAPVQYAVKQGLMTINFPAEFAGKKLTGEVLVYCPADEKKDILRNINVSENVMKITIPENNKGAHTLKVSWQSEGKKYYFEQDFFIQ